MFKSRSMGAKIGIFCGGLVLVIAALVSGLAYIYSSNSMIEHTEGIVMSSAAEASDYLERQIQQELEMLTGIASRVEIRAVANWRIREEVLISETARLQNFASLGIMELDGYTRFHDGSEADFGWEDFALRALNGEVVVSDPFVFPITNELIMMYAVPIYEGNRIIGVLVGKKEGTALSDMISGLGYGENGYAYVFNQEGRILAHPDVSYVRGQTNIFDEESTVHQIGLAVEKLGLGHRGVIRYVLEDDATRLVGLAPMEYTGWTIGVSAMEDEVLASVRELATVIIGIAVVVAGVGALLVALIGTRIARPLKDIQSVMAAVANGDLTQTVAVKSGDEVGQVAESINKSMENIRGVLQVVTDAINRLAGTSADMAAASEEVSASIEEVASTTNQFSATLDRMHNNARLMNDISREVSEHASAGEQSLEAIVEQMHELRKNTNELADKVNTVGASSKKIGEIVNTINNIAEQTNLLALNAAIEAARAGEHGRGFAVVADEVRKLAEQSAQATAEIAALVRQTQVDIDAAVREMHDESVHVDQLLVTVRESANQLHKILDAVNEITDQIEELTKGLTEVNASGHEIASATEEQAASIQHIATSAHELTEMAERLRQQTDFFTLDNNGK
ncbi:MAG: methyl-accepting chemotaxis protein [Firmicutes bacterium]|nr:methyl-accepting chemotaxis protein [Bacillota bacterium]